jgi:hypothetical protein
MIRRPLQSNLRLVVLLDGGCKHFLELRILLSKTMQLLTYRSPELLELCLPRHALVVCRSELRPHPLFERLELCVLGLELPPLGLDLLCKSPCFKLRHRLSCHWRRKGEEEDGRGKSNE